MDPLSIKIALAYGLDLLLGDPRSLPHPVRGLGLVIARGEASLRAVIRHEETAGFLLVLGVAGGTAALVAGLLWGLDFLSPVLAGFAEVILLYFCLSTRDLAVESWPVYRALTERDLPAARSSVAKIVGRDTESLTEPEVVRATVETIGESAMDGIVGPLFYAALGGAVGACLYKAVNTLDSMVGYRSARYVRFGKAAAFLDRSMNLIPARITAFLFALAAPWAGFSMRGTLRGVPTRFWLWAENSYIPEAAIAGGLGVQVGGLNFYNNVPVNTPPLGVQRRGLDAPVIPQAIRFMFACSFCALAATLLTRWTIGRFIG